MKSFKRINYAALMVIFVILATSFAVCFNALGAGHSVGLGNDAWWITSPTSGALVNHTSWVLDALNSKPVVVYVHSGCSYCKPQTDAMAEVVKKYGNNFTYYDIPADGSDARSEPALQAYDPNGNATRVPMTIIVTLAPSSGKVQVVWHSTEEVTGKAWIEDYVKDAIEYYKANSANWKK
jgi:thiol-disulfide isomerase/thioredoxin